MNTRCEWGGVTRTSLDPPQEPHYRCASRIPNSLAASRIEAPLRGAWRLASWRHPGVQLVAYLAQHAQATPRGRPWPEVLALDPRHRPTEAIPSVADRGGVDGRPGRFSVVLSRVRAVHPERRAIFDRYNIIHEQELLDAGDQGGRPAAVHPSLAGNDRDTGNDVRQRRAA